MDKLAGKVFYTKYNYQLFSISFANVKKFITIGYTMWKQQRLYNWCELKDVATYQIPYSELTGSIL